MAQVAVWEGVAGPLMSAALSRGTDDLQARFHRLVSDTAEYTGRAAQNFGLSGDIAPSARYAIMRCVAQMFGQHHRATGGYMDPSLAETVMETVTVLRETAFPDDGQMFPENDVAEITRRRIATATAFVPIATAFARYPIPGDGLAERVVHRIRDMTAKFAAPAPDGDEANQERVREAILTGLAEIYGAAHGSVAAGRADAAVFEDILGRFDAQADILARFGRAVAHQPTVTALPNLRR